MQRNAKLSKKKFPMSYVSHVLSEYGLKPGPEKIRAVKEMKPPENAKQP